MISHLIRRPAYSGHCAACHCHILIAIDGGLTVYADPISLDIPAEIAARFTGRSVYDLVRTPGGQTHIIARDIFRVKAGREYPVIGDHLCIPGHRPASGWKLPPQRGNQPRRKISPAIADASEIPF